MDGDFGPTEIPDLSALVPMFVTMTLLMTIGFGALMFWGILTKAGRPGWHSLIPVYQWVPVAQASGKPAWWGWIIGVAQTLPVVIMPFVFGSMFTWIQEFENSPPTEAPPAFALMGLMWPLGLAAFVFQILLAIAVARSFGKTDGWAVGLIFLPVIFYPVIGLGSSVYVGPGGAVPTPFGMASTPPPPPPPPPG